MDLKQLLTEFYHRKSDGIGMSERFPHLAEALTVLYDLLPSKATEISNEDAARLLGRVAEAGPKAAESLAKVVTDGPVAVLAEHVVDKALTQQTGSDLPALVRKELTEATSGLSDKVKDFGSTLIGICVTLGAYNLIQSGQDYLNGKDATWHANTGTPMREGSDLANDRGESRYKILPDPKKQSLSLYFRSGGNPFKAMLMQKGDYADAPQPPVINGKTMSPEMQMRCARFNPFILAPNIPSGTSKAMLARMAQRNPFMTGIDKMADKDPEMVARMRSQNPFMKQDTPGDDMDMPGGDLLKGPQRR